MPFAVLSVYWGKLESKLNRRWALGALCMVAAAQTGLQGLTTSFAVLAACRVMNGVISSGFNSLSHFAYAFRKCFDRRPSEYRQAWPDGEDAPSWPGTLAKYLDTLQVNQRMRTGE